jgi:hypothetical protein
MRRVDMLQDCLSVLSSGSMKDARAVVDALAHLSTWGLLESLWVELRSPDATASVRHDLATTAIAVHVQGQVERKEPTIDPEDAA